MKRAWRRLASQRFPIVVTGLVALLLLSASLVQVSLDRSGAAHAGLDRSSPAETGRSVLDVLGGVRQTLAAYMWTKTDSIFHEYLGHSLGNERPLFPYYWMISRLDPHFTMAVYYASWMLGQFGKVDEGLALAMDGARENPDSALLQENLASIYLYFIKDPAKALYHGRKAIELAQDEEERHVYERMQKVIEDVMAGRKPLPKVVPVDTANRYDTHQGEHGHEHDHKH